MQAELDTLESKLAQMIERHQTLRAETLRLRQQVIALESSNKLLADRLEEARVRVDALVNQIPD